MWMQSWLITISPHLEICLVNYFFTTLSLDHKHYYNFGSFPALVLFSLAYVSISILLLYEIKMY